MVPSNLLVFLSAIVVASLPLTAAAFDSTWSSYNRTLDGRRYSPLVAINEHNAASVERICSVKVAAAGALHSSPIMIDATLYVATSRATMAIDATNCDVIWKSLYTPSAPEVYGTVRGVAVSGGRLFRGTSDGHLLCLDAATGELLWKVAPADPRAGEFLSAAPLTDGNRVYIGLAGSDWGIHGRMFAFDAASGNQLWSFNLVPQAGDFGTATWKGDSALHGGGGTWTSYALDISAHEIFIPVGNPAPDMDLPVRRGINLFTNSLVVLDADTGKLKWWYQVTPYDDRDQDLAAPPVLFTLPDGRPAVALGSKNGYVLVLDRRTHRLIYQTPVTTIFNAKVPVSEHPTRICPGMVGGIEWNGPAFDEGRSLLITGATDWCAALTRQSAPHQPGQLFYGGSYVFESNPPPSGWITALDAQTGRPRWRFHAPAPVVAGITPTAGGVVFSGDLSGRFYIFRSSDGTKLLERDTGGAIAGGISTYEVDGRQFVALTSGNVSRESWGALGTPRIVIYGLPGNHPAAAPIAGNPDRGGAVFAEVCALCHGKRGEGGTGPALRGISSRATVPDIEQIIKQPRSLMPTLYPAPLTARDVADVAEYVSTLE